jgi:hypothetical protein
VLPFATSVPMVRVTFSAPSPSSLHVTAQDTVGNGPSRRLVRAPACRRASISTASIPSRIPRSGR